MGSQGPTRDNRDIYFNETTFRLELELLVDQISDVTLT